MPRKVSIGFQTELSKQVTQLGYLVQITTSQVMRWSNMGAQTYKGVPWIDVDFTIEGLSFRPDQDPRCTLRVQNLDNVAGALFLNEDMADAVIDIYQFSPNALVDGDAPMLVRMVFDGVTIGLETVEAQLQSFSSVNSFSPRRRVDSYGGFNHALPPGTIISWENEQFELVEDQSNG